jgi:hypothetical protein
MSARAFTYCFNAAGVAELASRVGQPLPKIFGRRFHGIEPGDTIWIVAWGGRSVRLIARLIAGVIHAGRGFLDAAESTPIRLDRELPSELMTSLTFAARGEPAGLILRRDGAIDPQSLRGLRRLSEPAHQALSRWLANDEPASGAPLPIIAAATQAGPSPVKSLPDEPRNSPQELPPRTLGAHATPTRAASTGQRAPAGLSAEERGRMALSVRQPWAELILAGRKSIEVRTTPTARRGRVWIYASRVTVSPMAGIRLLLSQGELAANHPLGLVVGSVRIVDCRPLEFGDSMMSLVEPADVAGLFAWVLADPRRDERRLRPISKPQPRFFRPFVEAAGATDDAAAESEPAS